MVVFQRFEYRPRECLFHALDCSMHLLGEIAVLLGFISFISLLFEIVLLMYQRFWYLFAKIASFLPNFSI